MATAQSYEANLPSTSVPKVGDFWSDFQNYNGAGLPGSIAKFFGIADYEQRYNNLMTENNRAYEQALLKEQRAYEEYVRNREYAREDTKYQRLRKDLAAAGINPLYALQGGLSGASAQSQPAGSQSTISGGSSAKGKSKDEAKGLAALIAGVAKVIASVL